MLVVLVGILLALYWDWRAIPLALVFFLLIRPLATYLLLLKTSTSNYQRWLMGWFGIRGIGSLYYLSYALNHDKTNQAVEAVGLTVSVVTLSIIIHGVSAQPVLAWYEKTIARQISAENNEALNQTT
jgi:sodium/hydrogen antiporter